MPFERPTLLTIVNRIVSDLNARVENSTTFLRRSVFLILARVLGGGMHLIYGFLDFLKRQLFISTADDEFLLLHGNEYGKSKKNGTKATGSCSISGTDGIIVEAGTNLQSDSGNIYIVDSDVTISGSVGTLAITAEEEGSDYNESGGVTLTFVSPISGVNTEGTVGSDGITGGVDEETSEEYRQRLLTRKRLPPHGGADFDYENWALEVSGVTRSWCIPEYNGIGTVGLAFVKDDDSTSIIPTDDDRNDMYNYILYHTDPVSNFDIGIPVTAEPGFFVIPLNALTVNFTIYLNPNTITVQASVQDRLQDLFRSRGGPEQAITISQMYEAIASAIGENKSKIISPTDEVTAAVNQVHVLGDITFGDYA